MGAGRDYALDGDALAGSHPPALAWAHQQFAAVVVLDGSTLDELLRKMGLLRDTTGPVLGRRIAALLDVITHLPRAVWYEVDQRARDQRFWNRVLAGLEPGMLLIFDLGFLNFARFDALTTAGVWFLTRRESRVVYQVEQQLARTANWCDAIVRVRSGVSSRCQHPLRLITWQHHGTT